MKRPSTNEKPYIKVTLEKFLKTNSKRQDQKKSIEIDQQYNIEKTQNKKENVIQRQQQSRNHKNNYSLQFFQTSQKHKDSEMAQNYSQKYSEFVNKIKYYNESRLKTMEPLKIDKSQEYETNSKSIYQQRIYKKAIQQKQKLYPFMQNRSKTQHQFKGNLKNKNNRSEIEQITDLTNFSPLDFKLTNNHSEEEQLLKQQKIKQKRFLIKTANRKMLRRQFGSNHSVHVNQNKITEQERKMSRKKSQSRASNSLDTEFKLVQETIFQNRRLVPSLSIIKSKEKTQQIRQKLRAKFNKYKFFDLNNQKIKYHSNTQNSNSGYYKDLNQGFEHKKIHFQMNSLNKQGLKGWDLPSQKNNLNMMSINDFQQQF